MTVLWAVHGFLSWIFGAGTPGLGFPESLDPGGIGYVTQLESGGSNDNAAIGMGAVLAIAAVIWGTVRFRKAPAGADFVAHVLLLAIQTLLLVSIEEGRIWFTVMASRNLVLALWMTSYVALWAVVLSAIVALGRSR